MTAINNQVLNIFIMCPGLHDEQQRILDRMIGFTGAVSTITRTYTHL
jgi:hypothetical protein